MITTSPDEPPADVPPDWVTQTGDVTCPLCGYNLRGLTDPRCPECGLAFGWAELMDARRTGHPWLFEHGRGVDAAAFGRTYRGTSRPRRFWRDVTPVSRVCPGRLVLYWLIACLPVAVAAGWLPAYIAVNTAIADAVERAGYTQTDAGNPHNPSTGRTLYGPASLDTFYPRPWTAGFADRVSRQWRRADGWAIPVFARLRLAAIVVAWPWLTFAAVLIFQRSMADAGARPGHVLRVAFYAGDGGPLLIALLIVYEFAWDWPLHLGRHLRSAPAWVNDHSLSLTVGLLAWAAITIPRMAVGFDRYLRLRRPVWTAAAVGLLAALAALTALV